MLPHRMGELGSPIVTPPPGEISMPALERGFRAGEARDPQRGRPQPVTPTTTLLVPREPAPAVELPGTPERVRHPVPGAAGAFLRRWGTGEWDQMNTGGHGELVAVAQTPQGEHQRVSNVRGNTYRLRPQPWDQAQVIGYQPGPSEV